jgi:hypothetical protein
MFPVPMLNSGGPADTSAQPPAFKPFWESTSPSMSSNSAPLDNVNSEKVNNVLVALEGISYVITKEDLGKLNPPDEYEMELKVMVEIRGYCQVSYKVHTPFSVLIVQAYS